MQQQKGQALISLLFFAIIATIVTSAATVIIVAGTQSTSESEQSTVAYYTAESGAENAVLQLLRDPTYTGETITVGNYSAVITANAVGSVYTATSSATVNNFTRKIQVTLSYTNNVASISAWKEIK